MKHKDPVPSAWEWPEGLASPAGYFACHYNECHHLSVQAKVLKHEIERLEHAVTCNTDRLFKVNPEEQQGLADQIEADNTDLFWLYRELEDEERTMCYGSDTSEQSKDHSQMYRDRMLARSEPSDGGSEW